MHNFYLWKTDIALGLAKGLQLPSEPRIQFPNMKSPLVSLLPFLLPLPRPTPVPFAF